MMKKVTLAEDAPPLGIEALKTNMLIWGLFHVENNETRLSHGTESH